MKAFTELFTRLDETTFGAGLVDQRVVLEDEHVVGVFQPLGAVGNQVAVLRFGPLLNQVAPQHRPPAVGDIDRIAAPAVLALDTIAIPTKDIKQKLWKEIVNNYIFFGFGLVYGCWNIINNIPM